MHINRYNLVALPFIFIPILVAIYIFFSGMLFNITHFTLGLLIVCYCLCAIGITIGYHRYLTHRSFVTGSVFKAILITLGCMAFQGPPSVWVGIHRKHHISADEELDPHSPYSNHRLSLKTFWHAHVGWILNTVDSDWQPHTLDLRKSKMLRFFDRYYVLIALPSLLLPAMINGLYYQSWFNFWEGFLVCGIFRVFLQQHVTFSINSVCHIWGSRHFQTSDQSKDNVILGLLALGEGWHNGHHAFPWSARHGLLRWQIDISYLLIKLMGFLGLVKDIKTPSSLMIQEKQQPQVNSLC